MHCSTSRPLKRREPRRIKRIHLCLRALFSHVSTVVAPGFVSAQLCVRYDGCIAKAGKMPPGLWNANFRARRDRFEMQWQHGVCMGKSLQWDVIRFGNHCSKILYMWHAEKWIGSDYCLGFLFQNVEDTKLLVMAPITPVQSLPLRRLRYH